jgi:hypothetical protein
MSHRIGRTTVALFFATVALFATTPAFAHCDGLDGPVVKAARAALEAGDVNLVLIWIDVRDEAEIRSAFARTLAVRTLTPDARALADTYFFETLVRLHRASEGMPYTGLKPAGQDVGPAVRAADQAVPTGSIDAVMTLVVGTVERALREHFAEVSHTKDFRTEDVPAGRRHVAAYVRFLHLVEGLFDTASSDPHAHASQPDAPDSHQLSVP